LIAISKDLRAFFNKHPYNSIKSWDCPSNGKWPLYLAVDKETKKFNLTPLLPCKTSWDFDKKSKYNSINWCMTFQVSDFKGKQFLDFLDNELYSIELLYTKGSSWLKYFSYSNSLCARATRAITNHTPTGEYCLCFFPKEDFNCLCGSNPIKSRHHILHECRRFNNYWNPMRDPISQFVSFLEFNPNAFSFRESIT